jgi:hypothetical protein
VPFERQLAYVRELRRTTAADRPEAAEPARVALVVPWGILPGDSALERAQQGQWGNAALSLDTPTGDGATYREVLAAVYREAARLVRASERFDVLLLQPHEHADAYAREIRIDGAARATRRG